MKRGFVFFSDRGKSDCTDLVHAEDLPGPGVEDDPLAGDGADHQDLPVGGEAGGLGLLLKMDIASMSWALSVFF